MSKQERNKNLVSLIINSIIFSAALISMLLYLIPNKYYIKANSFKYYTNLSNIFLGLASGAFIYINILSIKHNKVETNKYLYLFKYYAIITTTITFLVVIFFLGPTIGFPQMFGNPQNVMFHAVSPILGIVSFLFFDQKENIKFRHTLYAFIFTVGYAVFYAINLFVNNEDFYGFYKNGPGILVLITFLILGANFGLANLYKYLSNKLCIKTTSIQQDK